MRIYLSIRRMVILILLALICGLPALSTQAADYLPGAGIPEFMGGQPASGHSAPTTVVQAQATWVDDIANALGSYFKAHYPMSDFTSYLKKLTLVQDAEDRGDRRAVEVEMGAFFTMLTNRSQGISAGGDAGPGVWDLLSEWARAVWDSGTTVRV
jgi:hypothetical protein